ALLGILKQQDKDKDYSREVRRYLKDNDVYKLEVMHMDNEFFKTYIVDNNLFSNVFRTPSQKRLYEAKQYFLSEMGKLDLNAVQNCLSRIENSRVLTYSVNDTAEAT